MNLSTDKIGRSGGCRDCRWEKKRGSDCGSERRMSSRTNGHEHPAVSRALIDFVIIFDSLGWRRVKWSIALEDLGDSVNMSLFWESRIERIVADGLFIGFLLIFVIYRYQ